MMWGATPGNFSRARLWYIHMKPRDAVDAYLRREPVVALRATPGHIEEVLARPTEGGFHYEPEIPSTPAMRREKRGSMKDKGSDLESPPWNGLVASGRHGSLVEDMTVCAVTYAIFTLVLLLMKKIRNPSSSAGEYQDDLLHV
eukprot:gnl/TRDRNA2_/TRDRNA2_157542_c1_seq2.p1 gnl/TRDRNA2_/TRDRNA2_157542_c1~~gnl/TRDRNA2_/TRDRNA2_157542_c1_seq2.p1  ORF type:complete len:143 (+),score=23.52 gnl/TRDRNA2_/TRDRNA2_157542_c1_seq2:47-475(+)